MEQIIKAAPSIEYLEGKNTAYRKRALMIGEWSNKWSTSGEMVYNTYDELVNRSTSMERRKKTLLEEWSYLSSERLGLVIKRYTQSPKPGFEILIEVHRKQDASLQDDLNSFGLDSMGLFQIRETSALAKRIYQ